MSNSNSMAVRLLALTLMVVSAPAQITVRLCGSSPRYTRLLASATYRTMMEGAEQRVQQQFGLLGVGEQPTYGALTIRAVVHVLYNVGTATSPSVGKVSQEQVDSQIAALNRDYGPAPEDRTQPIVPLRFRDRFGYPNIKFVLESAEWVQTKATVFTDADNAMMKPDGSPPRDRNHYLNIWVVPRLEDSDHNGLLGYSSWPGEPADRDGVVIFHAAFGTNGTAMAPFDLGHTASHEIGHWLNLHHLWGDGADNPGCRADDMVEDTPKQNGPTQTCPAPSDEIPACDGSPDGAMFPNFLDYTQDACMSMFTLRQVVRMRTALEQFRPQMGR